MAHDVFICHSAKDRNVAFGATAALETAGIRCWIAPRDPLPGIPYGRQLVDAIAEAQLVLLIFSSNANESEHVLRELELASEGQKIVIPFRIEEVLPTGDLKYYIRRVHWLDAMSPPLGERFDDLVALVKRLIEKQGGILVRPPDVATPVVEVAPLAASVPATFARKRRLAVMVGAAIVAVFAATSFWLVYDRDRTHQSTVGSLQSPLPRASSRIASILNATRPKPRVTYPPRRNAVLAGFKNDVKYYSGLAVAARSCAVLNDVGTERVALHNDYSTRVYYEIGFAHSSRADGLQHSVWRSGRYYLDPGETSGEIPLSFSGQCGGYYVVRFRRVRFTLDRGGFVQ